jgi:predicted transposase YbfD/YdcC
MERGPASCWRKRGVRTTAHEGELSVAPAILATLPLRGRLVTGDALYCQRDLCQQIVAAGGDYFVSVKANQPDLLGEIRLLFDWPPPDDDIAMATQESRHGDRQEQRRLWTSSALREYLDWPGAGQVCKLQRVTWRKGRTTSEERYAITSLGKAVSAPALLRYGRGHWGIENRLHYVRDVTLGEDASQVRSGAAPEILAALRNAVIGLLRQAGWTNIAAGLRRTGWQPGAALNLLGISPP